MAGRVNSAEVTNLLQSQWLEIQTSYVFNECMKNFIEWVSMPLFAQMLLNTLVKSLPPLDCRTFSVGKIIKSAFVWCEDSTFFSATLHHLRWNWVQREWCCAAVFSGVYLSPLVLVKRILNASPNRDILGNYMLPTLWNSLGMSHFFSSMTVSQWTKQGPKRNGWESLVWKSLTGMCRVLTATQQNGFGKN